MDEATSVGSLLKAIRRYGAARREFLAAIGSPESNRDPLAEFAERIAFAALGGTMAASRVQKGWDFTDHAGGRVQVRYLSNPAGPWINGHVIDFRGGGCDRYALVIFEGLEPQALLVFGAEYLEKVCSALRKRHPDSAHTLQLTQANYEALRADPAYIEACGVGVIPFG